MKQSIYVFKTGSVIKPVNKFNSCGKCIHHWQEEEAKICPNCKKKFEPVGIENKTLKK